MNKQEYQAYLRSDHWKALREAKHKRCKRGVRCGICGSEDRVQTHHLQYRNIYDVVTSDLRLLCDRCHGLAHELMREGILNTKKYSSHHAMFCATKEAVKKALGLRGRNLFAENLIVRDGRERLLEESYNGSWRISDEP